MEIHQQEMLFMDSDRTSDNRSNSSDQNEEVLQRVGKLGRFQYVLIPVIWWCNITAICNEVYMVFGAIQPNCSSEIAIDNGSLFSENATACTSEFYGIPSEFNLVGSKSYLGPLMTSMQLVGSLFGALLGGGLADMVGRRLTLLATLSALMLFGICSAFSPNWPTMMVFRVLIGIANGGYFSVGIVYLMEMVGKDHRLLAEASIDCVNSVGMCWLSLLAWLLGTWNWLSLATNLQVLPSLILLCFTVESPRWLLDQGQTAEANRVVRKIARWNGLPPTVVLDVPSGMRGSPVLRRGKIASHCGYLGLFHTAALTKFSLLVLFTFFVTGSVGYGFIFNTQNLIGNIYLNFAILAMVNVVSAQIVIWTETFVGLRRRIVHQVALHGVWVCLTGIIVLYALNETDHYYIILNTVAFLGSMFSVPLWTISNLYSAELFPTNIRNTANGAGFTASKLGGILAPMFVQEFIKYWAPAPFIILAAISIANAVLAWVFIPETKGRALPQGDEEA